jgi:hypothetical protein
MVFNATFNNFPVLLVEETGLHFKACSWRGVQHYVIKFVSDLRQVGGFLHVIQFPPPIKLEGYLLFDYVQL